jgi:ABC-2 type transport system permease protein
MRPSQFVDKTQAFLRRDLLTALRYRASFAMGTVTVAAELAAFYFLARSIGPGFRPQGMAYFPFLLVGTGFYTFLMMGINSFLTSVQEAQQTGTLEVLMTTATPAAAIIFLSALSAFARNLPRVVIYFLGGILLLSRTNLPRPDFLDCIAVLFLSFVIAVSIGIFTAALQVGIQKGSAVMWLFGSAAWFLTGTLFPVTALPQPLRVIAGLIPITHCLNALRFALFNPSMAGLLGREMAILAAFSLTLLPLSFVFFAYVLRYARLEGTLSFY